MRSASEGAMPTERDCECAEKPNPVHAEWWKKVCLKMAALAVLHGIKLKASFEEIELGHLASTSNHRLLRHDDGWRRS